MTLAGWQKNKVKINRFSVSIFTCRWLKNKLHAVKKKHAFFQLFSRSHEEKMEWKSREIFSVGENVKKKTYF